MKKSTLWLLMSIIWAVNTVWAVVRFFDIHILLQGKDDKWIKEISRAGDKPTPPRIVSAALSLLLSNLYCAMFFKARRDEKPIITD